MDYADMHLMYDFCYGKAITTMREYSDWLWAGQLRGQSLSPDRVKNFLPVVQTGCGAHPASYIMVLEALFPQG
jgi:hypothetical protein